MPFSGPIEDRLAIRELYDTNADGGSRGDKDTWLGCFAEDARWKTPYFDVTGRDVIGATFEKLMGDVVDTTFFVQIGSIEVDGDTARCRIQQDENLLYANGQSYALIGAYDDTLVRRDGRWYFKEHLYEVKRERPPE